MALAIIIEPQRHDTTAARYFSGDRKVLTFSEFSTCSAKTNIIAHVVERDRRAFTITVPTGAIEIILEILFGQSSECYKKLYGQGLIYEPLWTSFEWSKEDFAHVLIQGKTEDVETTRNIIEVEIEDIKQNGINLNDFERAKRKIYGMYVREFNEVSTEATAFVTNYFKGINPFKIMFYALAVHYCFTM